MFTTEEATPERIAQYVSTLERERDGYARRLAGLTPDPAERPTARQLKARIRAVDAELARAKAIKPARPKPQ